MGKAVVAIKGYRSDLRMSAKSIYPEFILFEDGKTFIEFEDQDYYSYHDCDTWAKRIEVVVDKERWEKIMYDDKHYPYTDRELSF